MKESHFSIFFRPFRPGEASPEDIIGLEKQVIDAVKAKFGITLHPEVYRHDFYLEG